MTNSLWAMRYDFATRGASFVANPKTIVQVSRSQTMQPMKATALLFIPGNRQSVSQAMSTISSSLSQRVAVALPLRSQQKARRHTYHHVHAACLYEQNDTSRETAGVLQRHGKYREREKEKGWGEGIETKNSKQETEHWTRIMIQPYQAIQMQSTWLDTSAILVGTLRLV